MSHHELVTSSPRPSRRVPLSTRNLNANLHHSRAHKNS
jgi:hypothetical protein